MGKIVKLNEKQINIINENYSDVVTLYNSFSSQPYEVGQRETTVNGVVDSNKFMNPTITNDLSNTMTNNTLYRFYTTYGNKPISDNIIKEALNDDDNDGIDDFFDDDSLKDLDLISQTILDKLDILINECKKNNLDGKKLAIIINYFIENFDLTKIPSNWKKELILKINK